MSDEDICRDFLRRACTRGNSCKYRHPPSSEKTYEFCKDFQMSYCHRTNCKYIHGSQQAEQYYTETGQLPRYLDMRESQDRESQSRSGGNDGLRDEIPLCKDFLGGQCKRGMKCKYRHQSIGDMEYENRKQRTSTNSHQDGPGVSLRDSPRESSPLDEYAHDYRRRVPADLVSYPTRQSRYDDYPLAGMTNDSLTRGRTIRDYEEENLKLLRKVEELRKQVDDVTSTNEVLLEQNARLRAIKNDVSAVLLAESHLVRSTSSVVTPAQVHLTAATAGVVPYPARVAAAAPIAAQLAAAAVANPAAQQVITAELQGMPVSIASASMSSAMTQQVPAHSSVPPSVCVTSSLITYPLPTLRNINNVATVTVPNVATVNVGNVPTPNRMGP